MLHCVLPFIYILTDGSVCDSHTGINSLEDNLGPVFAISKKYGFNQGEEVLLLKLPYVLTLKGEIEIIHLGCVYIPISVFLTLNIFFVFF